MTKKAMAPLGEKALLIRIGRLEAALEIKEAENQRLRELLVRWMAFYPKTHDAFGDMIPLVKDTKEAIGTQQEE